MCRQLQVFPYLKFSGFKKADDTLNDSDLRFNVVRSCFKKFGYNGGLSKASALYFFNYLRNYNLYHL